MGRAARLVLPVAGAALVRSLKLGLGGPSPVVRDRSKGPVALEGLPPLPAALPLYYNGPPPTTGPAGAAPPPPSALAAPQPAEQQLPYFTYPPAYDDSRGEAAGPAAPFAFGYGAPPQVQAGASPINSPPGGAGVGTDSVLAFYGSAPPDAATVGPMYASAQSASSGSGSFSASQPPPPPGGGGAAAASTQFVDPSAVTQIVRQELQGSIGPAVQSQLQPVQSQVNSLGTQLPQQFDGELKKLQADTQQELQHAHEEMEKKEKELEAGAEKKLEEAKKKMEETVTAEAKKAEAAMMEHVGAVEKEMKAVEEAFGEKVKEVKAAEEDIQTEIGTVLDTAKSVSDVLEKAKEENEVLKEEVNKVDQTFTKVMAQSEAVQNSTEAASAQWQKMEVELSDEMKQANGKADAALQASNGHEETLEKAATILEEVKKKVDQDEEALGALDGRVGDLQSAVGAGAAR